MSGSPSLPARTSREASQRGEAPTPYVGAVPHSVYRERPQPLQQSQAPQHLPPPRSYAHGPPRGAHAFQAADDSVPLTALYAAQRPRGASQPAFQRPHPAAPGHGSEVPYPMPTCRAPASEHQSFSPPKSQRKTKGHVASACVPCKRAHLRCDAQRPCSRCFSNGKEEACIDIQHKKRGRPRLRDDRDARYDPLRPPQFPDLSLRRPLNVYPPGGPGALGSDDVGRRHPHYRPLETPASATLPSRYFERAAPDTGVYGSSSLSPGYPEPVAYLTMSMEFAKASPTFLDAIGAVSVTGRKLSDVAAGSEAERILAMQNRLVSEQKQREPNYLPPILGLGGPAFQGVGFTADDVARFTLNMQEQLAFVGPDGYQRPYRLRVGLGKEGSFFFVVMLLSVPPRYPPHPPSSGQNRVSSVASYHGARGPYEGGAPRLAAVSAFDPVRNRLGEGSSSMRPPLSLQNQASQTTARAASPSNILSASTYGLQAGRGRYSGPGEPTTQGVPGGGSLSSSFSTNRTGHQRLQLPPIRAQSERPQSSAGPQGWQREDRTGRVDIGGLIDRPEGSGKPR